MINTYNESNLHKTLKILYAQKHNGTTEIPFKNFIADIIDEKGNIIEIQTGAPSRLKEKVRVALENKTKITIVHPVAIEKIIETYDENKKLVSKRKSPKRCSVYSALEGLTGLAPFLSDRKFTVIFLEVIICEQRIKTAEPVQLKNKSRHFKKAWYKTGKKLLEIKGENVFNGKKSWLSLIPSELLKGEFSSKDVREKLDKASSPYANVVLWLLFHGGLISFIRTEGRFKIYSVKK